MLGIVFGKIISLKVELLLGKESEYLVNVTSDILTKGLVGLALRLELAVPPRLPYWHVSESQRSQHMTIGWVSEAWVLVFGFQWSKPIKLFPDRGQNLPWFI